MSKNTIDIYKIGSKVKLAEDVFGHIIGVRIEGNNHITYECSWWNGRSHDSKWFHEDEIEANIAERQKIGFI